MALSLCSNLPNSLHRQFNSARKNRNIRQSMSRSTYVSHWTSLSILCLRTTSLLIKNVPTLLSCSSAFYKFLNVHCISIHLWHTQSAMRTMPDAQPREHFCSKLSLVKHHKNPSDAWAQLLRETGRWIARCGLYLTTAASCPLMTCAKIFTESVCESWQGCHDSNEWANAHIK